MTPIELAETTGLSAPQVNRSLQTLERRLGRALERRHVTIPSWSDFAALADFEAGYLGMDTAGSQNEFEAGPRNAPHLVRARRLQMESCG